jgi:hypothetical protein
MTKLIKVILIAILFMIGGLIITLSKEAGGTALLRVIVAMSMYGGIRAIWNWEDKDAKKNDESDDQQLDKS